MEDVWWRTGVELVCELLCVPGIGGDCTLDTGIGEGKEIKIIPIFTLQTHKPLKKIIMKIVQIIAVVLFLTAFQQLNAQTKLVQITTIESTIAGGLGRSQMIITKEDGGQTETELQNLFSGFGIN